MSCLPFHIFWNQFLQEKTSSPDIFALRPSGEIGQTVGRLGPSVLCLHSFSPESSITSWFVDTEQEDSASLEFSWPSVPCFQKAHSLCSKRWISVSQDKSLIGFNSLKNQHLRPHPLSPSSLFYQSQAPSNPPFEDIPRLAEVFSPLPEKIVFFGDPGGWRQGLDRYLLSLRNCVIFTLLGLSGRFSSFGFLPKPTPSGPIAIESPLIFSVDTPGLSKRPISGSRPTSHSFIYIGPGLSIPILHSNLNSQAVRNKSPSTTVNTNKRKPHHRGFLSSNIEIFFNHYGAGIIHSLYQSEDADRISWLRANCLAFCLVFWKSWPPSMPIQIFTLYIIAWRSTFPSFAYIYTRVSRLVHLPLFPISRIPLLKTMDETLANM